MLPWLPHASAPLAQTLRNISVVMNQHLRRKPERRLRLFRLETDDTTMMKTVPAEHNMSV